MSNTPTPTLTDEQVIEFELLAHATASDMAKRYIDVPPHIMAAALNTLVASLLVDKDNYISLVEHEEGRLHTEEEHLKAIADDIKHRADAIRLQLKMRGSGPRAN